ncbi:Rha family transcriptional regulator [Aerococcus tenax]|uniref:Rha family transcriptional regulator n=1 Tax=Aerococcus tenax TaxID=3078812 RepID=UPI0018A79D37|nr:Rha family transcriptional regulator [Aerococcus tenax]
MQLVYIKNRSSEPYTLSSVIAECAEVQHKAVKNLIYKYKTDLEDLGVLTFQNAKPPKGSKGGRPTKDYQLTEPQATLVITWLDNTKPVRAFKKDLVKAFFSMRAELAEFRLQRDHEKLYHSQLNEAIDGWIYKNQHSYSNINSLLCQVVTGQTPRQLRGQHGASKEVPTLELMTPEQLGLYRQKEVQATICLRQQLTYSEIKAHLLAA